MKNFRNSALVVAALTAATLTAAPQRAAAQTYQIDCAILLCLSGGWPASVPCARSSCRIHPLHYPLSRGAAVANLALSNGCGIYR